MLIGLGVSFALPWLGSTATVDVTTVVNLALQALFLLAWYLVPLCALLGLLVGLLAGLAYPLIRRLPGATAPVAHAVVSGILASSLWFAAGGLPGILVDPSFLGVGLGNAAVLGVFFALVTIPVARYTVYRGKPAV